MVNVKHQVYGGNGTAYSGGTGGGAAGARVPTGPNGSNSGGAGGNAADKSAIARS